MDVEHSRNSQILIQTRRSLGLLGCCFMFAQPGVYQIHSEDLGRVGDTAEHIQRTLEDLRIVGDEGGRPGLEFGFQRHLLGISPVDVEVAVSVVEE